MIPKQRPSLLLFFLSLPFFAAFVSSFVTPTITLTKNAVSKEQSSRLYYRDHRNEIARELQEVTKSTKTKEHYTGHVQLESSSQVLEHKIQDFVDYLARKQQYTMAHPHLTLGSQTLERTLDEYIHPKGKELPWLSAPFQEYNEDQGKVMIREHLNRPPSLDLLPPSQQPSMKDQLRQRVPSWNFRGYRPDMVADLKERFRADTDKIEGTIESFLRFSPERDLEDARQVLRHDKKSAKPKRTKLGKPSSKDDQDPENRTMQCFPYRWTH